MSENSLTPRAVTLRVAEADICDGGAPAAASFAPGEADRDKKGEGTRHKRSSLAVGQSRPTSNFGGPSVVETKNSAKIIKNVDFLMERAEGETCAADSRDVVLYTGNFFAAYSADAGDSFHPISPHEMMRKEGVKFCCDQLADYIPRIDAFVWVLLSCEATIMLAVASPEEIKASGGCRWSYYHLTPEGFGLGGHQFDFPDISFGDNYMYMSVYTDIPEPSGPEYESLLIRLPLDQLKGRSDVSAQFVLTPRAIACPAQSTGEVGLFASLDQASRVRVYAWQEPESSRVTWFDVAIDTVATEDFSSFTPDGEDWVNWKDTNISSYVGGAARAGDELWLAWNAGRKVKGASGDSLLHPHIGLAVVCLRSRELKEPQRYIWNPDYAFLWPALASNASKDVAISFAWGGGTHYPQHGVGILTGKGCLISTTYGKSVTTGNDYVKVRRSSVNENQFVAAGFVRLKEGDPPQQKQITHSHYIIFEP